jgi:hypothetical protein
MCINCNKPAAARLDRRGFLQTAAVTAVLATLGCCKRTAAPPAAATAPAEPPHPPAPDLGMELFPDALGRPIATNADCPVLVTHRSVWTQDKPDLTRILLMNGINRLTVHHSGFTKPWTSSAWGPTKDEIQFIRDFHTGTAPTDRNWADIAYHFLVDRAGRVWQGRPLVYQGAHVHNHNEHNVGVVLLGNFDIQPVDAVQTKSLVTFIGFLRKLYNIPGKAVFTHQELADNKTDCPGTHLEQFMKNLRAKWA